VSIRGAVTPPLAAVLTAASQAPPARRAAGARAGLTESRQAVNIGLEQALERVQLRVPTMPAASNMAPVASSMPAPASPLSPVALSAGRDDSASPGVTRGGFRGLAQRALKGERGPAPVPLAEENVVPRDVALDRLDTAVADSLARILVREAKRHGIDLAESVQ
jgi:hypothetical protein